MKKILSLLLCGILLLSITSCGKDKNNELDNNVKTEDVTNEETEAKPDPVTEEFNKLADGITTSIEDDEDLSNLKEDVVDIKEEIQTKVAEADEEDKSDYDMQQIAVFMMEQAVNDYEAAKADGDEEKMKQAKETIDTAKKIWSSEIEE